MDLTQKLINESENRLITLKEIRLQIIGSSQNVMISNLKKLILALKVSLQPIPNLNQSEVEHIQEETLKVLQQLVHKNDPDLEIHFTLILSSLIQLLETSNQSLQEQLLLTLKLYCQQTQNIEQILQVALKNGIENENIQPHIRFQSIKHSPELISYGLNKQIEKTIEFKKIIETLLIRTYGDKVDSIRVQANESLREIIKSFQDYLPEILLKLSQQQRQQLQDLIISQQELQAQQDAVVNQFNFIQFDPVPQISETAAFGCLPLHLVQHIQQHSEWKMKLKVVENLEEFINEMTSSQKQLLMNYASSFITFIEQYLISDDNMKIIMAGIRILKFMMRNAQMAEKTNLTKLIQSLMMKLNDPKEIIRSEIETLFIMLSYHMKTKSLVLNLLHMFKTFRVSNEAKQSLLRSIISILLTQNGSQINDLQNLSQIKEDNLYIQLVEPLAYLFTDQTEPHLTRYLSQECLAVLASTLQRTQVLEALFECLADDKKLYDIFCDRLDADMIPFLTYSQKDDPANQFNIGKLEFPLPLNNVFSIKAEKRRAFTELQEKQEYPIEAADQYFGQDFTEEMTDADFMQSIRDSRQSNIPTTKKTQNIDGYNNKPPRQNLKERRVFGDVGKSIMGISSLHNKTEVMDQNKSTERGQIQEQSPYNQTSTPLIVKDKLSLLKNRGRINFSQSSQRKDANQDFGSSVDQQSTQASIQHSLQIPKKAKQAAISQVVTAKQQQNRINSPPFFSQQIPDSLQETPQQMYSNKYTVSYTTNQGSPYLNQKYKKPAYFEKFAQGTPIIRKQEPSLYSQSFNEQQDHFIKQALQEDLFNQNSQKFNNKNSQKQNIQSREQTESLISRATTHSDFFIKHEELLPLMDPQKQVNYALKDLQNQKWEQQNEACVTIRQALKYNKDLFTAQQINVMTIQLLKLAESLRSTLSKNALLTLQECFQTLGKKMDPQCEQCVNIILKKGAETNVFIAEQARLAMDALSINVSPSKLIQSVISHCDHKSYLIRVQIAKSFELLIQDLGAKLPSLKENDKMFQIIGTYINDSSPEVRLYARNSLLAVEKALSSKEEAESLIKKYITKEFDQKKAIDILKEGNEGLKGLEITLSNMKSKSPKKQITDNQGTIERQNFRKVFKPQMQSSETIHEFSYNSPEKAKAKASPTKSYINNEIKIDSPVKKSSQIQVQIKHAKNVQQQQEEEITQLLQLLLKQTHDQKKYALLNLVEASLKQKQLLMQNELFEQILLQIILNPIVNSQNSQQTKGLSVNFLEAEILNNLLPDVQHKIPETYLYPLVKIVASYLGSSNFQAKKNSENLLNKMVTIYPSAQIIGPLSESCNQFAGTKVKITIIDKICALIPFVNKQDPLLIQNEIFQTVYKLLDEYLAGRGKNMTNELKNSIENLVKLVYYEQGAAFIEQGLNTFRKFYLSIVP